jgi:hypothetical protein
MDQQGLDPLFHDMEKGRPPPPALSTLHPTASTDGSD